MKRPENFQKIDRVDFELEGYQFYFDFDNLQNKKQSNWVWVFCNGPLLGDYCVKFEFNWEMDCFSMKKCVLGEGDMGEYIFQDNLLTTDVVKTKDTFVINMGNFIQESISLMKFAN
jgi:hypothetical protein